MSWANFNLLPLALGTLIPPTPFQYRKATESVTNEFGQVVSGYTDWAEAYGICQPMSQSNEHIEGIDISKRRISVWIKGVELHITHSHSTADQVRYLGKVYNVVKNDEWGPYDDFYHVECVEVDNLMPEG